MAWVRWRIGAATIRSQADELLGSERILATFGPETIHPANGLTLRPLADGAGMQIDRDPAVDDSTCTLDPPRPVTLGFNASAMGKGFFLAVLLYFSLIFAGLLAWRRLLHVEHFRCHMEQCRTALERGYTAAGRFVHGRSATAIWLTALAGVLLSCYPIIFFGKSFVSPNLGAGDAL